MFTQIRSLAVCATIEHSSERLWSFLPHLKPMSTTIAAPELDETCAYCTSLIFDHDPICVRDCTDDCGSPTYFCNYACLSAYVDENNLTAGNACEWSPE